MAARLVDQTSERLLSVAEIIQELAIRLRFLDRVQVFTLDVLDKRDLQRFGFGEIANDGGNFMEPGALRGTPASLARDDLKARADMLLRVSSLTLPHAMVRVLLAEQLYRAWTITQNHPYHRV